ncbi:MAG: glycosyltransferase [Lachnospiraceae bacterium]|nr:glycosyltransferase [Lachnospiraceae bacterium]
MKHITVAIPCYNSQDYMRRGIESAISGGEDVEVLIVDDGSSDSTLEIAREYERKYPTIVKVIHQENAGHGGAVNTGMRYATGKYFLVVDSDDWLNRKAFRKLMDFLREADEKEDIYDLVICNYVYEKVGVAKKKITAYRGVLPAGRAFTWEDIGHFNKDQYILMHSAIFRTDLLRECKLKLPEHVFYVDNLFVFEPLPYVKRMYYLDINMYRYFIGREDQSVNEHVMIGRIDQQLFINRLMIDYMAGKNFGSKKLTYYMTSYLDIITCISSIMLILTKTDEALAKKKALWDYIKAKDYRLYKKLMSGILGAGVNLPGKPGRMIAVGIYKFAHKMIGFN